MNFLFPELETPKAVRKTRTLRDKEPRSLKPRVPRAKGTRKVGPRLMDNPCEGCSRAGCAQVLPTFAPKAKLLVVGMAPGEQEEKMGTPFSDPSGKFLRASLQNSGLDPETEVSYCNLARCRPENDQFETPAWQEAEDRCWSHLTKDLRTWTGPLLLLGTRPVQKFFGGKDERVGGKRGLWYTREGGLQVFVARHPANVLRSRELYSEEFQQDIRRAVDRVRGVEQFPPVTVTIYDHPAKAKKLFYYLATLPETARWFFDIETYDAVMVPSRAGIATDPFHPDFRVRGVAIAWSGSEGAWIELASAEEQKAQVSALMSPAFAGPAEKGAFVGGFDENGLVVPGWVSHISHRTRDPWLCAIALDAGHLGHSLERLVVDVLNEPQPKRGVDRGRIKEMDLQAVGTYAVGDACAEWRLDEVLQHRLDGGIYL